MDRQARGQVGGGSLRPGSGGRAAGSSRRAFLAQAGAGLAGLGLAGTWPWGEAFGQEGQGVEEVHVIWKTHLDIGYTDMACNVMRTYYEQFIPKALQLAREFRENDNGDRYTWTTGSWLIYEFLESGSPEQRRLMEQSIEAGDIVWHALPFTTHTELVDASLFRLGTRYAAELDRRFGRKTTAAKMTDVPGHTRGIVPVLAEAGIEFLHIGVNAASTPPGVPTVFRWRASDGSELIMMNQDDYGRIDVLPGGRVAVAMCFTPDNVGPHSPEHARQIYADLRKRFPGARVFGSTLDNVGRVLQGMSEELPVVTQEIGDSWIHGPASDPLRIAQLRALTRLRRAWLVGGELEEGGELDLAFGQDLLLVAEHTWGFDIKTHLKHWDVYTPDELAAVRFSNEAFTRTEASWQEQREYITGAVGKLPAELAGQARGALAELGPDPELPAGYERVEGAPAIENGQFRVALDAETGAISSLEDLRSGRQWAGPERPWALFGYQMFSTADYDRYYKQYVSREWHWLPDFGKPGIDSKHAPGRMCRAQLAEAWVRRGPEGVSLRWESRAPETADTGCPQRLITELELPTEGREMRLSFSWFDKRATRMPEGVWLSFVPRIERPEGYSFEKLGEEVSPLDVVAGGGRSMHGVQDKIRYRDEAGSLEIETLDAFVVSPGRPALLDWHDERPDMREGLHFCLCNNVWGTNFQMWYDEPMKFRFVFRFAGREDLAADFRGFRGFAPVVREAGTWKVNIFESAQCAVCFLVVGGF